MNWLRIRSVYMNEADDGSQGGAAGEQSAEGQPTQPVAGQPSQPAAESPALQPKAGQIVAIDAAGKLTYTDPPAPVTAPETYTDFALPEGFEMNTEMLGEFTPVLKELNLTQDQAQKVMDFAPKLVAATAEKVAAQTANELLERLSMKDMGQWVSQAKVDKEYGGEKFNENLAIANKAFDAFGTPELKAFLEKSGLGNHPELVRWAHRVGKAISADGFVPGGKTATPQQFYEKSGMNP